MSDLLHARGNEGFNYMLIGQHAIMEQRSQLLSAQPVFRGITNIIDRSFADTSEKRTYTVIRALFSKLLEYSNIPFSNRADRIFEVRTILPITLFENIVDAVVRISSSIDVESLGTEARSRMLHLIHSVGTLEVRRIDDYPEYQFQVIGFLSPASDDPVGFIIDGNDSTREESRNRNNDGNSDNSNIGLGLDNGVGYDPITGSTINGTDPGLVPSSGGNLILIGLGTLFLLKD